MAAVLGGPGYPRTYGVHMAPVRLVLVDDHEMVIEGLKAMLAAFSGRVEVVGHAIGAERALSVTTLLARLNRFLTR